LSIAEYGYYSKVVVIRQEAVQPIERLRKPMKYPNPVMTCTGYLTTRPLKLSFSIKSDNIKMTAKLLKMWEKAAVASLKVSGHF
jgi:hypothetical protein